MRTRRTSPTSDPILLGKPSPSLAKMEKMTIQELSDRITILATEIGRHRRRVEHLKIQDPVPQKRVDSLLRQVRRLAALERATQEKMRVQEDGEEPGQTSV